MLENINSSKDIKGLSYDELSVLSSEIRQFLIEKVEKCGGHLASNLGVVELTLALHRIFDFDKDHLIFDVGHQSYVHKILTGRKGKFDSLRRPGGLSGFTSIKESKRDTFGAGHSSTALSASLGFAEADKLSSNGKYSVCVVGDGAFTGGMVHEALNNCKTDLPLIIILNENGMSISNNKGAFASHLSHVRTSQGYVRWKTGTTNILSKIPVLGPLIKSALSFLKSIIKRIVYSSNYFEQLGLYYIGPVDGHNFKKLERALTNAKSLSKCVVVHVKTKKGYGYKPAEDSPDEYHSVSNSSKASSFHDKAADMLISLAEDKKDIVAITAAMGLGTSLDRFESRFPDRFFDVGIAEEHALTFSAGLCASGLVPYVGIYSTFLQRGYDNIIHDICLQRLPVKILIDRAGLAVADGPTHHGIFDVSFLSSIPGITVLAPITYGSLSQAIRYSYELDAPVAVRYPNSEEDNRIVEAFYSDNCYSDPFVRINFDKSAPPELIFVSYGNITARALEAEMLLRSSGYSAGTILVELIKPYDRVAEFINDVAKDAKRVLYVEEGIKNGGAGMITLSKLSELGFDRISDRFDIVAIDDDFVIPDIECNLYDYAGFAPAYLAEKMIKNL